MINDETLNRLYNAAIDNDILTTKELYSYGFTQKNLARLIEQGKLSRVSKGQYSFVAIDDLYKYGKKAILNRRYDISTKCFEKCYKINPNHNATCLQLFIQSIIAEDYEKAFEYFEVLDKTDNFFLKRDNNFYLYLLSIVTDIPDKYKERAKEIKLADVKIHPRDNKYATIDEIKNQNKVRNSALLGKFTYALQLLHSQNSMNINDVITNTLINRAVALKNTDMNTLLELAKAKQYEEIVKHLSNKSTKCRLSQLEANILRICENIVNIKKYGKLPEFKLAHARNLLCAIQSHDYILALKLVQEYNATNEIDNEKSILYILLVDICELIQQLSCFDINDNKNSENKNDNRHSKTCISMFTNIIENLLKCDLENAYKILHDYLSSIGKEDYDYLIMNLVKLSLIEKDLTFAKPIDELNKMGNQNYDIDMQMYVTSFYESLFRSELDKAKIYLDIISKTNKLDPNSVNSLTLALQAAIKSIGIKPEENIDTDNTTTSILTATSNVQHLTRKLNPTKDFDEINIYIIKSQLDVESACQELGLSIEEIDTIRLLYAIEYYSQGHDEKGNEFLKAFEKSKNKTEYNKKMYGEIIKNRRFYKNRVQNDCKKLSLTLRPRKQSN